MALFDGYDFNNTPSIDANIAESLYKDEFPASSMQLPTKERGELLIMVAYIRITGLAEVKARTILSDAYRSIKTALDDCGKDVRLIVMPTDKETKIECIYPTNKMI